MSDEFSDGKVVGLRSTAENVDKKVFRYDYDSNVEIADVKRENPPEELLVGVRDDSEAYCDWLGALTGD